MKLSVFFEFNPTSANLPKASALANLLAKGAVKQLEMPLEANISSQMGLCANPDYPIAPVSASADGLNVGNEFWLRADPVHLMMRRDSLSLSAPVPQPISSTHAVQLLECLNAHFQRDGLQFVIGQSGAWYCHLAQAPDIKTVLPNVALDKNMFNFMPQGQAASQWKAIINEVQMLLFSHIVNAEREAQGQLAVNSVWFSGGGVLPAFNGAQQDVSLVISHNPLYQGLARWAGIAYRSSQLSDVLQLQEKHIFMEFPAENDADFDALRLALKANKIKQLHLAIGYFEKTLLVCIKPLQLYQFWRRPQSIMEYFND